MQKINTANIQSFNLFRRTEIYREIKVIKDGKGKEILLEIKYTPKHILVSIQIKLLKPCVRFSHPM